MIKIVTTVDGIKWRGPDTIGPGTVPSFRWPRASAGWRTNMATARSIASTVRAWGPPFELSKDDFGAGTPAIVANLSTMYVAVAYGGGIWFAEFPADNPAAARRKHVRRYFGGQQSWSNAAIAVSPRVGGGAPQVRIAYFHTLKPDSGLSPSFALAVADRPATPQPMWPQHDVEKHYQQYTKNGEGFSLSAATELLTGDFDLIASFTIPKTPPQKVTRFYRQNVRKPGPWQIMPVLQDKLAQVSVATQVFGCDSRVRIVVAEETPGNCRHSVVIDHRALIIDLVRLTDNALTVNVDPRRVNRNLRGLVDEPPEVSLDVRAVKIDLRKVNFDVRDVKVDLVTG